MFALFGLRGAVIRFAGIGERRAGGGIMSDAWAKLERDTAAGWGRRLSLIAHSADVAAVFEALIGLPTVARRMARLAGRDRLDQVTVARLSALVALHDIGKANRGFQNKQHLDPETGRRPADRQKIEIAGHIQPLLLLLKEDMAASWSSVLPVEVLVSWGDAVLPLLDAVFSHHGTPWRDDGDEATACHRRLWQPADGYDPFAALAPLGRALPEWFPAAFGDPGPDLPDPPAFQHAFAGLVTLADWIGSNADLFPLADEGAGRMARSRLWAQSALRRLGLSVEDRRVAVDARPVDFGDVFRDDGGTAYRPTPLQAAMADLGLGLLLVVEDATGAGKTEAALWRFRTLFRAGLVDGLYFALPTRVAAAQLYRRVERFVEALFMEGDRPAVVQAVPGYLRAGDATGRLIDRFQVLWDDDPDADQRLARWAAESPRQYLAGQIAVGTIDQVLISGLRAKHAPVRSAALLRHLLVVDELHASDVYMHDVLRPALQHHLAAGGHALLMSATLGSAVRHSYLTPQAPRPDPVTAEAVAYPALHHAGADGAVTVPLDRRGPDKTVAVTLVPAVADAGAIAARALAAARAGAKVLVVRNTVELAVAVTRALEQAAQSKADADLLFRVAGPKQTERQLTVHHGRFARDDRHLLDRAVEEMLGKDRPAGGRVVVGTQTLEMSLDLDADLLITDLCPMDVLLQRLGRLYRHPDRVRPTDRAECVVLVPPEGGPEDLLAPGMTRFGWGGRVYPDGRILALTWRALAADPLLTMPAMQRRLVEQATHPDHLEAFASAAGGDWPAHAREILGGGFAERNQAAASIARRDLDLCHVDNAVASEKKVMTRLGTDDVWVEFPEPCPTGPFGQSLPRIACPLRLLKDADPAAVPEVLDENPLRFILGAGELLYDVMGLRTLGESGWG